jgi:high-affinity iron transporter
MAVFREAFEVVLFLRAVLLESGGEHGWPVFGGVIMALFLVTLLSITMVRFSARIPIRQLFSISSGVMWVLAFMLLGKGIHSLQEAGLIPITEMPWNFRMDWLGVYPVAQSFVPQLMLVILAAFLWLGSKKTKLSSEVPA